MIDPELLTIAVWRTTNKRRQHKAEQVCKNFALVQFQPTLYAGRLSHRERKEFEAKLRAVLNGKLDLVHFFASCRSCAQNSSAYELVEAHYQKTIFEIV